MTGLRTKRRLLNITQTALGAAVGVKGNTVSYWENGFREPNLAMLKKLSAYFKCPIEELL